MDGRLAWTYVTLQDFEETGATEADVDGLVQYLLRVEGVKLEYFVSRNGIRIGVKSVFGPANWRAASRSMYPGWRPSWAGVDTPGPLVVTVTGSLPK